MNSKRAILLDSVRKLLALKIPDREIVANLRQVNVSEEEARSLLAEARGEKPVEPAPSASPASAARKPAASRPAAEPLDEDVTESEDVLGEVYSGLEKGEAESEPSAAAKEEEDEATPARREPTPLQRTFGFFGKSAVVEPSPQRPTLSVSRSKPAAEARPPASAAAAVRPQPTVDRLWESGILTTIDARLDEMKRLKQELDSVIDAKIAEALKRESAKSAVLLESQRALLLSKVQSEFEANRKQLEEILSQKLEEIRRTSQLTQENVSRIQAQRQLNEQLSKELAANLRLLEDTKAKWLAETNNELARAELKFNDFLSSAGKRLDGLEARIGKAIEVENHITEGFVSDARLKIDALASKKSEELEQLVRQKLKQIDQAEAIAALDAVDRKLKDLEGFRESLRKDVERDFDTIYKAKMEQYNKQVKEKLDSVDAAAKGLDSKEIRSAIGDFRVFQEDFNSTAKANIEKFNAAKKELNASLAAREKAFDGMVQLMEQRLRELGKLEERLTALLKAR